MALKILARLPHQKCGFKSEEAQLEQAQLEHDLIFRGGNTTHELWIGRDYWAYGIHFEHAPVVGLGNDGDTYYTQYFVSRDDINQFIAKLEAIRDEAFPETL